MNSELIYNQKYLKGEGKANSKEGFQCFYSSNISIISIPVIVIDSVYRKN